MLVAPLPNDENTRLEALYALNLLDTPAEDRFDSVTKLTAEIFQVPMAFVSLIDRDRQLLKSRVGIEVSETSRDLSLCAYTILNDDVLVIPDTHLDHRFADNPLVTGKPFLRFYAGHPLRAPGGEKIGTLCIADREPRNFSAGHCAVLKRLGALVERELRMTDFVEAQTTLLAAQSELLKTQKRLKEELEAAARYVESLLPAPIEAPVRIDWRFLPSDELGGDCLGYNQLKGGQLAFYVLDVCGHGVGAAMLSVMLLSILRSQSLEGVDFADPAAVLSALNRQFQMSLHGNRFFTMWYGVLDPASGRLVYCGGGHPPALVVGPITAARRLVTEGIAVGCLSFATYTNLECYLEIEDVLYLFSDGAYEVRRRDGSFMPLDAFEKMLATAPKSSAGALDTIITELQRIAGESGFVDDVSIMELRRIQ